MIERYADRAVQILTERPLVGATRLVAVDGPAGAGKSTFAGRLARALRQAGATVAEIHTDDLLEGWTDLVSFWPRLEEWILAPLRRGEPGAYRAYDWHRGRFGPDWRPVPVRDVCVIEGVTTTRRAVRSELALGVFVVADPALRLARGIERDGEALRPQWLTWMQAEVRHFADDDTALQADLTVDGAPTVPHDPEQEFVRLPATG